jgi:hypothetical protein
MEKDLLLVCSNFNQQNIKYAVAFSYVLRHYGIVEKVNDIDIIVASEDIDKAKQILDKIGKSSSELKLNEQFSSYFIQYQVNKTKFEIISNLKINFGRGNYQMIFDDKSIQKKLNIEGVTVPLLSLEDLYVIYMLIKGKEEIANKIEIYLKQKGVKDKDLLIRCLSQELPLVVINRAYVMFNKKN